MFDVYDPYYRLYNIFINLKYKLFSYNKDYVTIDWRT
jgi:hypothetical protein